MHRHFATLFDRRYAEKGLALHTSLLRHSSEPFTLHILALDQITWKILYDMNLENVDLMYMEHFEYMMHMEPVKASRSWQEYCWTCASSFMEMLMPWLDAEGVTYLDADLFFFSDPKVVHNEIGEKSIGITPHRFPPAKLHMVRNGKFNVGWVSAKNTKAGRDCISKWAAQCREWCFNRNEGDRFGDQRYLDTWESDYTGEVCAISNIGVNLAPWNISQYSVSQGPRVDGAPVVCYHLHEFQNPHQLTNYTLRDEDRRHIYAPYVEAWQEASRRIVSIEQAMEELAKEIQEQPIG